MRQLSLLAEDNRLVRLSDLGDPLQRIEGIVDWELFRPLLNKAFKKTPRGAGGRPPKDRVMMFKIVMLQQWYNISDAQAEFQINDRLSFQRFLGLTLDDRVPDEKTIWAFKEHLKNSGYDKKLFDLLTKKLEQTGIITREGSIVDASFVEVPRQRNTREENKEIKEGRTPKAWTSADKPTVNKVRQKDVDARWVTKNKKRHYGYKNHAKIDKTSKLIIDFEVTAANVHDSKVLQELVTKEDKEVYADSAYVGRKLHQDIKKKHPDVTLKINEKGYRNRPLTEEQKASNTKKSKIRCRIEHVFGHMANSMNGTNLRVIGLARAKREVCMKNIAYNIQRFVFLARPKNLKIQ